MPGEALTFETGTNIAIEETSRKLIRIDGEIHPFIRMNSSPPSNVICI
jgi:hypothetical protein